MRWIFRISALFVVLAIFVIIAANHSHHQLPEEFRADRIVVEKAARKLTLFRGGTPWKTYHVALGRAPVGQKEREGDQRTPEGNYIIDAHKPDSDYHLALHISYPSKADLTAAAQRGDDPGGDIMVHGLPNGYKWVGMLHRQKDWTAGCIAVTDEEIEEIYRAAPNGTVIEIKE